MQRCKPPEDYIHYRNAITNIIRNGTAELCGALIAGDYGEAGQVSIGLDNGDSDVLCQVKARYSPNVWELTQRHNWITRDFLMECGEAFHIDNPGTLGNRIDLSLIPKTEQRQTNASLAVPDDLLPRTPV